MEVYLPVASAGYGLPASPPKRLVASVIVITWPRMCVKIIIFDTIFIVFDTQFIVFSAEFFILNENRHLPGLIGRIWQQK